MKQPGALRDLLTGGDRRSIAQSDRARKLVEKDRTLVAELVRLTDDGEWLVVQRAFDLLEKLAREHSDWGAPYKRVFIGPHAASDKWESSDSKALQARARAIRKATAVTR